MSQQLLANKDCRSNLPEPWHWAYVIMITRVPHHEHLGFDSAPVLKVRVDDLGDADLLELAADTVAAKQTFCWE